MSKLVKEISHVQLPVQDRKRAIDFYVDVLGFNLQADFGDFALVGLDKGANIFLWETRDQTTANFSVNGEQFPAFGIEIESADQLINRLKDAGTKIIGMSEDGERIFVKFLDPDGNMIVAHEEPKAPDR